MNKASIRIINPVHTGNGQWLNKDIDFINSRDEKCLVVLDDKKVLNVIGDEQVNLWVNAIANETGLKELIATRLKGKSFSENLAKRTISTQGADQPETIKKIREQIHNGYGQPYLAGSSIKGAIRTAILSHLIQKNALIEASFENSMFQNNYGKFNSGKIESKFLGKDTNSDFLRFLQVGDFHFEHTRTAKIFTLNEKREGNFYFKNELTHWLEVLDEGWASESILRFNMSLYKKNRNLRLVYEIDKLMEPNILCSIINDHTKKLINKEIMLWSELSSDLPGAGEEMIEDLKELLEAIENPEKINSCIFRIGYGSGFQFITGGWQEEIMKAELFNALKKSLRKPQHEGFRFPKTRRIIDNGALLGFVKLTILE